MNKEGQRRCWGKYRFRVVSSQKECQVGSESGVDKKEKGWKETTQYFARW